MDLAVGINMNKYIVLCRGAHYESDYYIGIEAYSKQEVVNIMNKRLNLVLEENKKRDDYVNKYNGKDYGSEMNEDEYAHYRNYMDACPYKYTEINDLPFELDQVFNYPDEFWKIISENEACI